MTVPNIVIKLHNTKTRKKEVFTPINDKNVRMYVCGPTVYDRAHLGNARPVVVFDVLNRLLRHVYGEDHVKYVRNFTDVDDKINARAAESGRSIGEITDETIQWFLDDMAALGAIEPNEMPRATEYIGTLQKNGRYNHMIGMIQDLIDSKHAYPEQGHVLFAVESYKEYGALSGRSIKDMIAGARVEIAPYKRNPMDFVLWKPSVGDQPGWDSPWGNGRPGWHIECSAMAYELLGENFDIHGGGNDLMFPHHENEIAQSCCAHPEGNFANYWLHNEMLQVEGKKMSKSLGNFFTVHDLLAQGVAGEVIRFVFLSTHYRKPMDWTEKKRNEAEATLQKWSELYVGFQYLEGEDLSGTNAPEKMIAALSDDLNTSQALTVLRSLAKTIDERDLSSSIDYEKSDAIMRELIVGAELLGIDLRGFAKRYLASEKFMTPEARLDYEEVWVRILIKDLLEQRAAARAAKDFARADVLRDGFAEAGVVVKDTSDGATWELASDFDPSKLEALK